jgi:FtsP/CotA-like multicopper oxidase with cupredoxin domain
MLACGSDDNRATDAGSVNDASQIADASAPDADTPDSGSVATVETFRNPPESIATPGAVVQLEVKPAAVAIGDATYCLRTYNGSIPGPTIRVPASAEPRQIRVDLDNQFQNPDVQPVGQSNFYDFNTTNLHTHGLHVTPEQTTDNAFMSNNVVFNLEVQSTQGYRFDIDENGTTHEAGSFLYQPQAHGSTAIQIANGMTGAIIIEGAVDALAGIADANERVFVLQHIPHDEDVPLANGEECTEANLSVNTFTRAAAVDTSIVVNGLVEPTLVLAPGDVERWRFAHAGVDADMTLSLRAADGGTCATPGGAALTMNQIAADGFTMSQKLARQELPLSPGYRADVLVEAPATEGLYCLIAQVPALAGPGTTIDHLVARVVVEGSPEAATGAVVSDNELAAVATPTIDCAAAVDGTQNTIFSQLVDGATGMPCEGGPIGPGLKFNINCRAFDPANPRVLQLGQTEEWVLSSGAGDHVFHIQVNAFTVCDGTVDGQALAFPHWRDTLKIREQDGSTRVRSQYQHFTGAFTLQTQRATHQDLGTKKLVRIDP